MINDFDQIDNSSEGGDVDSSGSFSSEDSQEPYFHVDTGKVVPAREAWGVLAAEGHPKYQTKLSGAERKSKKKQGSSQPGADSVFRSSSDNSNSNSGHGEYQTETEGEDSETDIHQTNSFTAPTQSSIDRALHPESPNYMVSPDKDIKSAYYKRTKSGGSYGDAIGIPTAPELDDEDDETDPIILRARAMALAAQNGQKLTPEQMQLIAQPDVQQQKLIEEAKRVSKAKEMLQTTQQQQQQQQQPPVIQKIGDDFKMLGADFKKFIKTEKDKTPLQWGADLGKFIESQSMKMGGGANATAVAESLAEEEKFEKSKLDDGKEGVGADGNKNDRDAEEAGKAVKETPPQPSPKSRKRMEGFGTDPFAAPRQSPVTKEFTPIPDEGVADKPGGGAMGGLKSWSGMPPLPLLNESIRFGGSTNKGDYSKAAAAAEQEPIRISGILWKRRSGLGKHSTIKAWERRRVELRGSKLMYYSTEEEAKEGTPAFQRKGSVTLASDGGKTNDSNNPSGVTTPQVPGEADGGNVSSETPSNMNMPGSVDSSRKLGIFGQAAQAAEQRIQLALESLTGGISADTPRGILDLLKENASVSASMGHSGAPTPFCLSIKVKNETRWKFCFDGHAVLMEWLSALTDVIVKASVEAAKSDSSGGTWEIENYCVQSEGGVENMELMPTVRSNASLSTDRPGQNTVDTVTTNVVVGGENQWMISGTNLKIAWAAANLALIVARCSSTTIDQYWKLIVSTNFGIWQLCTRPKTISSSSNQQSLQGSAQLIPGTPAKSMEAMDRKSSYKPIAGSTTLQVTKVEDPHINKGGHEVPSWIPISSSEMDVRSHGYLTTKKKIPCPGELYECVAVDCFNSNSRFGDIAPRVKFPFDVKFDDDSAKKTWKSPDIFIASVAIPTEAPRFGQSTDDGPGLTIIGYFRMKQETRNILRRVTAEGYDASADTSDVQTDVQKRLVNGVCLWERYCNQAPSDPTFQARFKLIPGANLEELGCPSYISKYNGKPVLIKRNQVTGFFTDYPNLNVMEFDISLHPFPYLFKQAMNYLKDYLDGVVATYGFVIEGRNDGELPEVVIGAMKVCSPGPKYVCMGEEFFAGTCLKSAEVKTVADSDTQ